MSAISVIPLSLSRPDTISTGEIQMSSQCNWKNKLYPSWLCLFKVCVNCSHPLICWFVSSSVRDCGKWKLFICVSTFLIRVRNQIFIFGVFNKTILIKKVVQISHGRWLLNLMVTRLCSPSTVWRNNLTLRLAVLCFEMTTIKMWHKKMYS